MIVALGVALAVAFVAYVLHLLTAGGAIAAAFIGAATVLGGPGWVVLLLFFFITSSALSRWRASERDKRIGSLVEKVGQRDAIQVLANGAVFALAAALSTRQGIETWHALGAGAIASATADTWSTEIGTVIGGTPRHLTSARKVAPGTSGGVTLVGTLSGLLGAVLAAIIAVRMDWETPVYAIVAGGVAGLFVDSLLGATIQERRWCTTCSESTERRTHSCGTKTAHRGGLRGLNNDVVNLVSIIAGAVVTWTLS